MHATATQSRETHNIVVGYVCWLLGGFFGMHRFYYGKQISGVIWFCTLGLLLVGWLVDLILIPGLNAQANGRYRAGPLDYTVAWLLYLFLGILGVHRFYLGKWVTGLIWLVTAGLVGIGLLYDALTLNEQVSEQNALLATQPGPP